MTDRQTIGDASGKAHNPRHDANEKIIAAFAKQLDRFVALVEEQYGKEVATSISRDMTPTSETARQMLQVQPSAAIDIIEKLGRLVDDCPKDVDAKHLVDDIVRSKSPKGRLGGLLNQAHREFYEKAVSWKPGDPPNWQRGKEYWETPGKERKHTKDISFQEIYPEAPKGVSDIPEEQLRQFSFKEREIGVANSKGEQVGTVKNYVLDDPKQIASAKAALERLGFQVGKDFVVSENSLRIRTAATERFESQVLKSPAPVPPVAARTTRAPTEIARAQAQETVRALHGKGQVTKEGSIAVQIEGGAEQLEKLQSQLANAGVKLEDLPIRDGETAGKKVLQIPAKVLVELTPDVDLNTLPERSAKSPVASMPQPDPATESKAIRQQELERLAQLQREASPDSGRAIAPEQGAELKRLQLREDLRQLQQARRLNTAGTNTNPAIQITGDAAQLQELQFKLKLSGVKSEVVAPNAGQPSLLQISGEGLEKLRAMAPPEVRIPEATAPVRSGPRKAVLRGRPGDGHGMDGQAHHSTNPGKYREEPPRSPDDPLQHPPETPQQGAARKRLMEEQKAAEGQTEPRTTLLDDKGWKQTTNKEGAPVYRLEVQDTRAAKEELKKLGVSATSGAKDGTSYVEVHQEDFAAAKSGPSQPAPNSELRRKAQEMRRKLYPEEFDANGQPKYGDRRGFDEGIPNEQTKAAEAAEQARHNKAKAALAALPSWEAYPDERIRINIDKALPDGEKKNMIKALLKGYGITPDKSGYYTVDPSNHTQKELHKHLLGKVDDFLPVTEPTTPPVTRDQEKTSSRTQAEAESTAQAPKANEPAPNQASEPKAQTQPSPSQKDDNVAKKVFGTDAEVFGPDEQVSKEAAKERINRKAAGQPPLDPSHLTPRQEEQYKRLTPEQKAAYDALKLEDERVQREYETSKEGFRKRAEAKGTEIYKSMVATGEAVSKEQVKEWAKALETGTPETVAKVREAMGQALGRMKAAYDANPAEVGSGREALYVGGKERLERLNKQLSEHPHKVQELARELQSFDPEKTAQNAVRANQKPWEIQGSAKPILVKQTDIRKQMDNLLNGRPQREGVGQAVHRADPDAVPIGDEPPEKFDKSPEEHSEPKSAKPPVDEPPKPAWQRPLADVIKDTGLSVSEDGKAISRNGEVLARQDRQGYWQEVGPKEQAVLEAAMKQSPQLRDYLAQHPDWEGSNIQKAAQSLKAKTPTVPASPHTPVQEQDRQQPAPEQHPDPKQQGTSEVPAQDKSVPPSKTVQEEHARKAMTHKEAVPPAAVTKPQTQQPPSQKPTGSVPSTGTQPASKLNVKLPGTGSAALAGANLHGAATSGIAAAHKYKEGDKTGAALHGANAIAQLNGAAHESPEALKAAAAAASKTRAGAKVIETVAESGAGKTAAKLATSKAGKVALKLSKGVGKAAPVLNVAIIAYDTATERGDAADKAVVAGIGVGGIVVTTGAIALGAPVVATTAAVVAGSMVVGGLNEVRKMYKEEDARFAASPQFLNLNQTVNARLFSGSAEANESRKRYFVIKRGAKLNDKGSLDLEDPKTRAVVREELNLMINRASLDMDYIGISPRYRFWDSEGTNKYNLAAQDKRVFEQAREELDNFDELRNQSLEKRYADVARRYEKAQGTRTQEIERNVAERVGYAKNHDKRSWQVAIDELLTRTEEIENEKAAGRAKVNAALEKLPKDSDGRISLLAYADKDGIFDEQSLEHLKKDTEALKSLANSLGYNDNAKTLDRQADRLDALAREAEKLLKMAKEKAAEKAQATAPQAVVPRKAAAAPQGKPAPDPIARADRNQDGKVDIKDFDTNGNGKIDTPEEVKALQQTYKELNAAKASETKSIDDVMKQENIMKAIKEIKGIAAKSGVQLAEANPTSVAAPAAGEKGPSSNVKR